MEDPFGSSSGKYATGVGLGPTGPALSSTPFGSGSSILKNPWIIGGGLLLLTGGGGLLRQGRRSYRSYRSTGASRRSSLRFAAGRYGYRTVRSRYSNRYRRLRGRFRRGRYVRRRRRRW